MLCLLFIDWNWRFIYVHLAFLEEVGYLQNVCNMGKYHSQMAGVYRVSLSYISSSTPFCCLLLMSVPSSGCFPPWIFYSTFSSTLFISATNVLKTRLTSINLSVRVFFCILPTLWIFCCNNRNTMTNTARSFFVNYFWGLQTISLTEHKDSMLCYQVIYWK